jgi:hypothetical protein
MYGYAWVTGLLWSTYIRTQWYLYPWPGNETSDLSTLYFTNLECIEQLNSEKAKFTLRMDW